MQPQITLIQNSKNKTKKVIDGILKNGIFVASLNQYKSQLPSFYTEINYVFY
jgi:hypothetical protein